MTALGKHILVEFSGCKPEIMNDVAFIEESMVGAAQSAGATVINSTFHHFSPYGVSGVVVIQESHLAIHTWPEYGYAAVDLFTCGDSVNPWVSFDELKDKFQAKNYSAIEMRRGSLNLLQRLDFEYRDRGGDKSIQRPEIVRNVWFTDKDDNQALSLRYTGDLLYNKQTPYQRVGVIDTYAYGKALVIDNMFMITEKEGFHYSEMISHPAMFAHGNVRKALVIGGGDGGTVAELLKHSSVERVDMVEIDGAVVEASKEFLPSIACAFDNPKLNLTIGDGIAFVASAPAGEYDLVIVDGSDPVGPAEGLFSAEFYQNCRRVLSDNGLLVVQGESPEFNKRSFVELNQCLKGIFGAEKVNTLLFNTAIYPSGVWSFMVASKGTVDPRAANRDEVEKFLSCNDLKYYNYDLHIGAFSLPTYVKRMLNE